MTRWTTQRHQTRRRQQSSDVDLFCERCKRFSNEVELKKISQETTLANPIQFWVCWDELACKAYIKANRTDRDQRMRRDIPADVSMLYS